MLSAIVKQHQAAQVEVRKENERLKLEAVDAAQTVTKTLVCSLNTGVAKVFNTQKQLEGEVKLLQGNLVKYTKLSNQWITMIDGFNQALKEIGDVENWAQRIESDMHTIVEGLDYVHKATIDTQLGADAEADAQ